MKKILILAPQTSDKSTGGQVTFTNHLKNFFVDESFEYILCNSFVPPHHCEKYLYKIYYFVLRFIKMLCLLIFYRKKISHLLLLSSGGLSIKERYIYSFIAHLLKIKNYIFMRDGNFYYKKQYINKNYSLYCNKFIVQNSVSYNLLNLYKYKNVDILRNPIDLNNNPIDLNNNYIDGEYNINFIYIGWLTRTKGMDNIIRLIKSDRFSNYSNYTFSFFGDGPYLDELLKLSYIYKNINVFGWVSNATLKEYLSLNNILLFPSKFEGMPNTVLEALSYGNPVVLNRFFGFEDCCNEASSCNVDFDDIDSVFESIDKIISQYSQYKINSFDFIIQYNINNNFNEKLKSFFYE